MLSKLSNWFNGLPKVWRIIVISIFSLLVIAADIIGMVYRDQLAITAGIVVLVGILAFAGIEIYKQVKSS